MVSLNGNGFLLKGDGFVLQGGGFPLQGNFGQNFKSSFQPKIWNFFEKILRFFQTTCAGNNYMLSKPTIFFWNIFEQIEHQKQIFFFSNMPCFSKMITINDNSLFFKNGFHK